MVAWGQEHRSLDGVCATGVDEVLCQRGYGFLMVEYQIDEGWVPVGSCGSSATER